MSSERSISPDPLPRSHSHSSVIVIDDKDNNGRVARQPSSSVVQKRRRDDTNRTLTPPSPRSAPSRSRSRSSVEGSRSPVARTNNNIQRSPSPPRQSSSSSKRRRVKEPDSGRHICAICSNDVESAKRLYGVLDNCDHIFCYECIVSWKRSKYSNAESESCPVCKVRSAFITPSKHWYDDKDDKHRIVKKHKNHLKTLPCRYYLRHGFCRFSDRCFYDHQEAARQYRQQNQHSSRGGGGGGGGGGDRERDRDRHHSSHNGSRSHYHSPSPPPPPSSSSSSRHSSTRYRERAY